jgi:hypothetical protein
MQATFYHITPQRNVPSILENGLIPSIGPRSLALGEETPASYHFSSPDDLIDGLQNWLLDEFDEDEPIALLAISVNPRENEFIQVHFEHQCRSVITPKYIEVISMDLDNESSTGLFEKLQARSSNKTLGSPSP